MSETYAFLKECTAMELVALIAEAREVGDDDLKKAALIEAGIREKNHIQEPYGTGLSTADTYPESWLYE